MCVAILKDGVLGIWNNVYEMVLGILVFPCNSWTEDLLEEHKISLKNCLDDLVQQTNLTKTPEQIVHLRYK